MAISDLIVTKKQRERLTSSLAAGRLRPLVIAAPRVHTARHVRTVVVNPHPPAESALPRRDYFQVRVLAAWPLSRLREQT